MVCAREGVLDRAARVGALVMASLDMFATLVLKVPDAAAVGLSFHAATAYAPAGNAHRRIITRVYTGGLSVSSWLTDRSSSPSILRKVGRARVRISRQEAPTEHTSGTLPSPALHAGG